MRNFVPLIGFNDAKVQHFLLSAKFFGNFFCCRLTAKFDEINVTRYDTERKSERTAQKIFFGLGAFTAANC